MALGDTLAFALAVAVAFEKAVVLAFSLAAGSLSLPLSNPLILLGHRPGHVQNLLSAPVANQSVELRSSLVDGGIAPP